MIPELFGAKFLVGARFSREISRKTLQIPFGNVSYDISRKSPGALIPALVVEHRTLLRYWTIPHRFSLHRTGSV